MERRIQGLPPPFLLFRDRDDYSIDRSTALHVNDLLSTWPQTVPERIDRCLCNLAGMAPDAGQSVTVAFRDYPDYLFFTEDGNEGGWYIKALSRLEWVEHPCGESHTSEMVITPKGWARIHELKGGKEKKRNPAFVAMWFGKKGRVDRTGEMIALFEEVIEPACKAAGYLAIKADSEDHNDFIMSKIIEDIRRAPFVIAELTENSSGVYFEAGFAKGRGIDVIYCAPRAEDVHFDVRGVNLLEWGEDHEFFRNRLESWILGTVGRGPHKFDN